MEDLEYEVNQVHKDNDSEIDKELECAICHDLLVAPVTLMCQHTFCRLCIKSYADQKSKGDVGNDGYQVYVSRKDKNAKCPMCRCTVVIPPNDNFVLKDIIEGKYPEQYRLRYENFHKKGLLKLSIRDQIKDEIRTEVFNGVVDDAVHENIDAPSGVSPYVNIPDSNRHWITKIFPSVSSLTIVWGCMLLATAGIMVQLRVAIKTYIGVCIVMWGLYVFLVNKY